MVMLLKQAALTFLLLHGIFPWPSGQHDPCAEKQHACATEFRPACQAKRI